MTKQENSETLNNLINKIANRNTILFLGSGFSASAHGLDNEDMPIAEVLAQRIGELGDNKFDAEKDLRYASSRFLSENNDPNELIKFLRETFTVRSVEEHHKSIALAPWRRVYTTNYDLCFERAAEQNGNLVDCIDLSASPSEYSARNNVCIHLNGSLKSLNIESLESSFKLTNSSYLSTDSFLNSKWFYSFQRDLEFSSAIVFVGYSMYDIEVQKILHSSEDYASKTYFIVRSIKEGKAKFTLEQFGTILPIGAEAFGSAIKDKQEHFQQEPEEVILASLWEYTIDDNSMEIRDSDVDTFLMHGEITDSLIDAAITGAKGAPILIPREELAQARELLKAGSNIAVTADFGNGKSIFLRMLRTYLSLEGTRVFTADQADLHQHEDLEKIIKSGIKACLFVDSYEQNFSLIKHYGELNPPNLRIVIAARTNVHNRYRSNLIAAGISLNEIAIDDLSSPEANEFVNIIDNVGYWGVNAALQPNQKRDIIIRDNQGQLSINLLSLLSAPQIVSRVRNLVSQLISVGSRRDTVFAVALLSVLDKPLNFSLISEVAFNDDIYKLDFRNDEGFKQLFGSKGTRGWTKSSIFALTLISNQFPSTYIVDQLLKIVASIENDRSEMEEKRIIRKDLLRFSVIERLLPNKQRIQNLVRYYESLKREVNWLKFDPHFWLQYGMAQLTYKNYEKAQSYFDQAYALAAKKENYHTHPIDSQQARLYLFQSAVVVEPASSFKFFIDAHQLISRLPDDWHKYRQVEQYKDVFDRKFSSFSKSNKASFKRSCISILKNLRNAMHQDEVFGNTRKVIRLENDLQGIIDKIAAIK